MGPGLFCLNRVLKKYQLLISFQIKIVTCVFEYLFDLDAGRGSDLQNTKFHVQVFTETLARTCLCLCSNVYIHVVMRKYQVSESCLALCRRRPDATCTFSMWCTPSQCSARTVQEKSWRYELVSLQL